MSKKNSQRSTKASTSTVPTQSRVKVLYQNLGGVWYAFAAADEDNVFFGRVPFSAAVSNEASKKESSKKSKGSSAKAKRPLSKAA